MMKQSEILFESKKILLVSISVLMILFFTGCSTKMSEYSTSVDNVQQLKGYQNRVKFDVLPFTATNFDEGSVLCRLQVTVSTPKGSPFSEYIREALIEELKMAEIYDKNSNLKISGNLNNIYASSAWGNTYWEADMTITSTNGKSIKVKTRRDFPSSYAVLVACDDLARQFSPTINQLISDIINHQNFTELLR